jgi:hypothetical protein
MRSKIDTTSNASFNPQKLTDYSEPVEPAPITLTVTPTLWQRVWRRLTALWNLSV